ncbi:MAG: hypothetical protein ACLTDV_12355 [Eubacterium sp.]
MIGGQERSDPARRNLRCGCSCKGPACRCIAFGDTAGRLHNKEEPDGRIEEDEPDHLTGSIRKRTARRW